MKYFLVACIIIPLLSCNDNSAASDRANYLLLKEQVNALESKVDSLLQALNKKETLPVKSKQKKRKNISESKTENLSSTNTNTDNNTAKYKQQHTKTNLRPAYTPKKETQTYQGRVGAICCDGTRSYATGRGACSHHGGVCRWLYQ